MKTLGLLTLVAVAAWVMLLGPGWLIWGSEALLHSLTALLLCLVPALATLSWIQHLRRTTPEMQVLACLGSSGVRLFLVLGAGLVLSLNWPDRFPVIFWLWLLVFYLGTLGAEIALLLRSWPVDTDKKNGAV